MRSNVAYLVVILCMLACFTVVQLHPLALLRTPGNWVFGGVLFAGAIGVAMRRPWSYGVGLFCCLFGALGGLLSYRGWLGTQLPGHPILWVVVGLYVAFRLTMNRQAEQAAQRRAAAEAGEGAR